MSAKSGSGGRFEDEIALLFQLAGYAIEQNVDYGGQEFDVIATKRELSGLSTRIAVECKYRGSGSVGNQEVFDFVHAFQACAGRFGLTHGLIVSNAGFSRPAQVAAQNQENIQLVAAAALENELLGTRTYLEAAKRSYRSDFTNYIALRANRVALGGGTSRDIADVAGWCAKRLGAAKRNLTVLLGDFGSGKTTIAEQAHAMLAGAFLSQDRQVFPLILYLRTLEQHDSEADFIESHLKLSSKDFTVDRLEAVRKSSRIALILDGFDEVAANASEEERMRLFSRVMRVATRGHSVLLTSRPSYFNNLDELDGLIQTLIERDHAAVHKLDGQVLRRDQKAQSILDQHQAIALRKLGAGRFPRFSTGQTEVLVVSPLSKADIIAFFTPFAAELKQRHRKTPEQVYDFLTGIYDLTDLLTRPLLLDMFVELLRAGELDLDQPDMQIGPAGLYHLYINYHLTRDWDTRRFLQPQERLAFARAAAIAMLDAGGSLEASYDSVWKVVREDETALPPERRHLLQNDREGVVTDVRVCSFMNVTPAGRIEFSHKSFMEYFVAEVIVSRLGGRNPIDLLTKPLNYEILYFMGSYALVRAETRLEIVQHLQHVAYGQSATYRANLVIALLFSEQVSNNRVFSDVEFSRIRVARKSFQSCQFRRVTWHYASLLHSSFGNCEFDELRIEGEVHSVTLTASQGLIQLPALSERLAITGCRSLFLDSAADGVVRIKDGDWQRSTLTVAANLVLGASNMRAVALSLAAGKSLHLNDTVLRDSVVRHQPAQADPRRLPMLYLDGARLANATFLFLRVTREQFVDAERMLRSAKGILVVDDPGRHLEVFRERDEAGVSRYAGWEAGPDLLLLSAESFSRLDMEALAEIARLLPTRPGTASWSVAPIVDLVRNALGRSRSDGEPGGEAGALQPRR